MAKKNRMMFQFCVRYASEQAEINAILAETNICDLPHLEYYKLKFVSGDDYMALQDHKQHLYHFVVNDTLYLNDLAFNMGFRDEARFYSILHKYAMEDMNDAYQRRLLKDVTQFIPEDKFERFTKFNNSPTVQKLRVLFMLDEAGLIKDETLKRNLEDIARLE